MFTRCRLLIIPVICCWRRSIETLLMTRSYLLSLTISFHRWKFTHDVPSSLNSWHFDFVENFLVILYDANSLVKWYVPNLKTYTLFLVSWWGTYSETILFELSIHTATKQIIIIFDKYTGVLYILFCGFCSVYIIFWYIIYNNFWKPPSLWLDLMVYILLLWVLSAVTLNFIWSFQNFYIHVFNGCYAVLLFIVLVFFLIYGVQVFFKVR